ncbi:MAG TPA: GST-like protein, partial [Rhodobacteraceae bacterium]|nr:GST-like protein [Paracoccaceae bacterium]
MRFVFLWLSLRVIVYRRGNKISMGHNGNNSLLERMRAQG